MRLFMVVVILLSALPGGMSQEDITQGQMFIDIYVSESGRVLVTGYGFPLRHRRYAGDDSLRKGEEWS